MRSVFGQAALVLLLGDVLSLAANALSPRGLKLDRDYFPPATPALGAPASGPAAPPGPAPTDPYTAAAARLRAAGLQPLPHAEVVALFQSPDAATQKVIFVDARDDEHYQAGHLPGAWQFYHYRPAEYMEAVLPPCLLAEKVVVYCTGGDCEDSEFAARTLTQSSVAKEKLFIYVGGITEWETKGQPVELGARGSGSFRIAKP
jgi:rhodanese-related sulfurtransferase